MTDPNTANRLSRISTCWSMVWQANQGPGQSEPEARQALMQRYCGAVYRYLLASLGNADAAEDLCQEFALEFLRGNYKRADPDRGRFRDYVKKSLYHLMARYHRGNRNQPRPLPPDSLEHPAAEVAGDDQEFVQRWREELLNRAWESLEEMQARTGSLYHTVLNWRVSNPGKPAAELAERLSREKGRPFTEIQVRQTLHRAREKYAVLLIEEVARSLETSEPERIDQELSDLGLLPYCRPSGKKNAGE